MPSGYISSSESPDLDEPELDEQEAEPGDQELDITEENADKEPTNEVEIESIKDASKKIAKEAEKVKEAYEEEWDAFMEMADGQIPEDIDTRADVNVARDMDYPIFDFKVSADDDTYLSRHDYEKKMSHHYSTFRDFFLLVGRNGIDETEAGRGIKEIDKVSPIGEYTMEAWLAKTVTERLPDIKIRQARNIIEGAKANYGRTFRVEENPNVRNPFVSDDFFCNSMEESIHPKHVR